MSTLLIGRFAFRLRGKRGGLGSGALLLLLRDGHLLDAIGHFEGLLLDNFGGFLVAEFGDQGDFLVGLGLLDGQSPFDLAHLQRLLLDDVAAGDRFVLLDAEFLDLAMPGRLHVRDFHLLLGLELGLIALHLEHFLTSLDVLLDDRPLRLALDLVALDVGPLRDLGDLAQPLGVEHVSILQLLGIGLIERRDRDRFQCQSVVGQVVNYDRLHGAGELIALRVQLDQFLGGRDGAKALTSFSCTNSLTASALMFRPPSERAACRMSSVFACTLM